MEQTVEQWLKTAQPIEAVANAARYFPLNNGRYEVKPGLVRFGTDFGNGQADQQVFQIDDSFAHYRQMKQQARAERLNKYVQTHRYGEDVAQAIGQFIVHRLVTEHPQHFQLDSHSNHFFLHNQLTQETLILDANYQLQHVRSPHVTDSPAYTSTLDALANQVQEDLTVVSRHAQQHWMSAIHLCFPNHWAAEEKIGQPFARVHAPVAGMATMNRRGDAIVNTMITHHPVVRFAWGFSTDTRLNHHPQPPAGTAIATWIGREFNPHKPQLYLRIERQVVWGFPAVDAALFTIRTYFRDCQVLKQDAVVRSRLCSALRSMSPAALTYKGLSHSQSAILRWLEEA